jgi:hypothetical protein
MQEIKKAALISFFINYSVRLNPKECYTGYNPFYPQISQMDADFINNRVQFNL